MSDHRLPMTGENAIKTLKGLKTMTRRVVAPQPIEREDGVLRWNKGKGAFGTPAGLARLCPYGGVGDGLLMTETWAISSFSASFAEKHQLQVCYRAGYEDTHPDGNSHDLEWRTVDADTWRKYTQEKYHSWHSSRFMPSWASRCRMTLAELRVERLQDITDADAQSEGMPHPSQLKEPQNIYVDGQFREVETYRDVFISVWNAINRSRGYTWETNPWVWVLKWPA